MAGGLGNFSRGEPELRREWQAAPGARIQRKIMRTCGRKDPRRRGFHSAVGGAVFAKNAVHYEGDSGGRNGKAAETVPFAGERPGGKVLKGVEEGMGMKKRTEDVLEEQGTVGFLWKNDPAYGLLRDLARIRSISATPGENELVLFLKNRLGRVAYWQDHPEDLFLAEIAGDALERKVLFAFVPAARPTARTVILSGHFDVVDAEVYGPLKDLAFDAEAYTRLLREGPGASEEPTPLRGKPLSSEAAQDLASGNYLFGRGLMDMKGGLALQAVLMEEFAERREAFDVNLLFVAVPDEENNSAGMRGAVPHLVRFARERGLDYLACIDGEPSDRGFGAGEPFRNVPEGGRGPRYFFIGTAGKIMPAFLFAGKEAHGGEYFSGFNATLAGAHLVTLLEGNPRFAERGDGEVLMPPVCLKFKDLRETYSITLPDRCAAYFSMMTLRKTPGAVLEEMRDLARQALGAALAQGEASARDFGEDAPERFAALASREIRALSFAQLCAEARKGHPALDEEMGAYLRELPETWDERDKGLALMERVLDLSGLSGPLVVVGFLAPYYPHRGNQRRTDKERRLLKAMELVADEARRVWGEEVRFVEHFGGITDMSFLGFQGDRGELEALAENSPGWGTLYSLPMDDLMALDVPVANIGPAGKDAHKDTERLELEFSFRVAPRLLRKALEALSRPGGKTLGAQGTLGRPRKAAEKPPKS